MHTAPNTIYTFPSTVDAEAAFKGIVAHLTQRHILPTLRKRELSLDDFPEDDFTIHRPFNGSGYIEINLRKATITLDPGTGIHKDIVPKLVEPYVKKYSDHPEVPAIRYTFDNKADAKKALDAIQDEILDISRFRFNPTPTDDFNSKWEPCKIFKIGIDGNSPAYLLYNDDEHPSIEIDAGTSAHARRIEDIVDRWAMKHGGHPAHNLVAGRA